MLPAHALAFLLLAPVAQTDTPDYLSRPQPIDKKYPLPQNPALAKRLREEHAAAVKKATSEVFAAGKQAKAPWAAAAAKAMDLYAARYARKDIGLMGVEYQDFLDALAAAVRAGCDDPLVRYWNVRFTRTTDPDREWDGPIAPADRAAMFRGVLKRLPETPYPASIRVHMVWNSYTHLVRAEKEAAGTLRPGELADAEKAFWMVFAEVATAPDRVSRETAVEIAGLVGDRYQDRGDGREAGWKAADKVLADARAPAWVRSAAEGHFLIAWAWDARGTGVAATVTPEGARLMRERLGAARDRFKGAWEAEPSYAGSGVGMIAVAMGLGLGREEMEVWFRRALEADPDSVAACYAKLEYLKPKWHGSEEDVADFLGQCYRTGNWYSTIPLLLDQGLYTADATRLTDPEWSAYYDHETVWPRTRALYEGYLKEYPGDRWARTRYAILCAASGRRAESASQFEALKGRPWCPLFTDRKVYQQLLVKVKAHPKKDN